MPGIMGVGRQYATSALTGAITGDATARARTNAKQQLDLQAKALEEERRFREKQQEIAEKQGRNGMVDSALSAGGAAVGFAVGGPVGMFVGAAAAPVIKNVLGGLF